MRDAKPIPHARSIAVQGRKVVIVVESEDDELFVVNPALRNEHHRV